METGEHSSFLSSNLNPISNWLGVQALETVLGPQIAAILNILRLLPFIINRGLLVVAGNVHKNHIFTRLLHRFSLNKQ